MTDLMDNPKVQYLLLPLPGSSQQAPTKVTVLGKDRSEPYYDSGKGAGKGKKGAGKGKKGTGKGPFVVPDDCARVDSKRRPICYSFNLGGCSNAKPGGQCNRGMHVCWKTGCNKHAPYGSCSH